MTEDSEEHKRLIRLIRQIAREEAYAVLGEHMDDYEHKEKPTSATENFS